jgi:hypothetical protein
MKLNLMIVVALVVLFSTNLHAQKVTEFADDTKNPDKISSYLDFPSEGRNSKNGGGYSANVDLLVPKPKKVALVSYYLYDPACGKSTGGVYLGQATASVWRTPDDVAQVHVDGFYQKSIDTLKSVFRKYGMELQTPEEFIDTDEKADFFYNFNQESAKKEKTKATVRKNAGTSITTVAEATIETIKICPTGKGYRAFFVANEYLNESKSANFMNAGILGANRSMTSSLGYELTKGLGVDAVVVCYIVTRKPKAKKQDYAVNSVNLYMFGPNPKMESIEDKNRGQFYGGVRYFNSSPKEFQSQKEGTQCFDNMNFVMKSLSERLCNYVINKEK